MKTSIELEKNDWVNLNEIWRRTEKRSFYAQHRDGATAFVYAKTELGDFAGWIKRGFARIPTIWEADTLEWRILSLSKQDDKQIPQLYPEAIFGVVALQRGDMPVGFQPDWGFSSLEECEAAGCIPLRGQTVSELTAYPELVLWMRKRGWEQLPDYNNGRRAH